MPVQNKDLIVLLGSSNLDLQKTHEIIYFLTYPLPHTNIKATWPLLATSFTEITKQSTDRATFVVLEYY